MMKGRNAWRLAVSGLCAVSLVAAFGVVAPETITGQDGPVHESAAVITVGLVTNEEGLGDGGWNDLTHAGLVRAHEELGVEVTVLEPSGEADYEPMFTTLAASGTDLVLTSSWWGFEAMAKKAKAYPAVSFAGVDTTFKKPSKNLVGTSFKAHEGAYLAGVVAGLATLDDFDDRLNAANTIAFVGGMDIPAVENYQAGYIAGARWANPRIKVISSYADSFVSPERGEELAGEAIDKGADIVFAAAGGTGPGCLKACQDKGALFIGVDVDEYLTSPEAGDVILTSAVKQLDVVAYALAKRVVDGTFVGGKNLYFGLKEGGVDIAPFHEFESVMPTSTKQAVERARGYVVSGKVVVPATRAQLKKATVGKPVAPAKMSRTKSYSVYGTLKPRHAPGSKPVRIYRWRKVGTKWKSYGYVKAKASDYSAYSRYRVSLRLSSKGEWRLRAYHPADAYHSKAWSSGYRYVTVK